MTSPAPAGAEASPGGDPAGYSALDDIDALLLQDIRETQGGAGAGAQPPLTEDPNPDSPLPPLEGAGDNPQQDPPSALAGAGAGAPGGEASKPSAEETPQGGQEVDPEVDQWGMTLVEKPQRVNEIPAGRRAAVLERALFHAGQRAVTEAVEAIKAPIEEVISRREREAYEAGYQAAQAQVVNSGVYAEVEALRKSDPAAYADLEETDPEKWSQYLALKAQRRQEAVTQTPEAIALQTRANELMEQLRDNPKAFQAIVDANQAHHAKTGAYLYPLTEAGVQKLRGDVKQALAGRAPAGGEDPQAEREARARQEAAKVRPPAPRTAAAAGGGGGAAPTGALGDDIDALISQGWREDLVNRK